VPLKRHKYRVAPAEQREADGIRFDSKKERARYIELKRLRDETKEVVFFLRQVPFDLPGNTKYRVDFVVWWADGGTTFEDVKGMRTAMYKMKKKQVEDLYQPVHITEI
jgi:hypothetical protein